MKSRALIFKVFVVVWFSFILISCGNEPAKTPTASAQPEAAQEVEKSTIVFFGNSLTAAFGIDPELGFVSRIQQRIDSLNLPYTCVNAGNSGETTHGGLERLDWVLRKPVSILVLELGANDGLRGLDPPTAKANLIKMINIYREANPEGKVLLLGIMSPPSMGEEYTREFNPIFKEISEETGCALVPFLLDGVAGNQKLNLPDGIHPTAEGHAILTETVWKELKPLLKTD
ncbi:arylesterase [bacterium SCSIO 12741]|nr:arylesterase [bacterium SCSIO 12741]